MILNMEGTSEEIKPFIEKIECQPYVDLFDSAFNCGEVQKQDRVKMTCYLGDEKQRFIKCVLSTVSGDLEIPLVHFMEVKIGKTISIYGRTFDIF
ncbi:hypothetical protein CLV36_102386 [Laceyella sediminis]|uniref:Uncharacterized protein n=1 Tax=Laceyella sediminis TaxID=573074 RepID=A0ABX5EU07_9BACL|nr:hypothetical protein [Laceyella sediminis]PRZ16672.1 hypothetical protein CLV36_102386 [Laceyella sediminis]